MQLRWYKTKIQLRESHLSGVNYPGQIYGLKLFRESY